MWEVIYSRLKSHPIFKNMQKLTNEELQSILDQMNNINKRF